MSTFETTLPTAGDAKSRGNGKLRDVTLAYVRVKSPEKKYQSEDLIYTLDCIVDKKTAKAFKKQFSKNTPKDVDTADFEAKYKIAPPFPDEDEQWVIKLTAKAQITKAFGDLKAGDLVPYAWDSRPKIFELAKGGVKDITNAADKQVGNGSKGHVGFSVMTNDFGTFPMLTSALITELVAYTAKEGGTTSEWGDIIGGVIEADVIVAPGADDAQEISPGQEAAQMAEAGSEDDGSTDGAPDPFAMS